MQNFLISHLGGWWSWQNFHGLGKVALWSSNRPDWSLVIRLKKSSSGTVGASRGGAMTEGAGAEGATGTAGLCDWGSDDLCSSIRDPWHFISISKKDSSGNWSSFAVATLNLCKISGCLALFKPGKICPEVPFEEFEFDLCAWACCPGPLGWPMRSKSWWGWGAAAATGSGCFRAAEETWLFVGGLVCLMGLGTAPLVVSERFRNNLYYDCLMGLESKQQMVQCSGWFAQ